jgi:hypothetical protein
MGASEIGREWIDIDFCGEILDMRGCYLARGVVSMEVSHKDCLHCAILQEVGRRLENDEIDGKGALDNLALVMADILATAPVETAEEMKGAIMQNLSEDAVRERRRTVGESAVAPED